MVFLYSPPLIKKESIFSKEFARGIVSYYELNDFDKLMNEETLIKQCQSGDSQAFEKLITHHYDTIYRFAYRWCGDKANAEDITQIACLKLAKSIKQFRFESSFTSWLYSLVVNCAKDFYKSPSQHNVREEQHKNLDNELNKNSDTNASRYYARQILEYINQLQEDLKDTILLVYGTGLSHGEAAKQLNVKESTVSWRVHEARKILKQLFNSSSLDDSMSSEEVRGLI